MLVLIPLIHEFRETVYVCVWRCTWWEWVIALTLGLLIIVSVHRLGRAIFGGDRTEDS